MKGIVEIENVMKLHGGWLSQLDIYMKTGINKNSIKRSISTMLQREQIIARRQGRSTGALYKYVKDYERKKKPIVTKYNPDIYIDAALERARAGAIESMRW